MWFGFRVHQVQRHRRVALAIASHAFIPAEGSYLPCLIRHHHWFIEVHQCVAGSSDLHLLWREDFLCMSGACVHNHRRRKTNSRLVKSGLHSSKHGRRHTSTYIYIYNMYHLYHQQQETTQGNVGKDEEQHRKRATDQRSVIVYIYILVL